MKKIFIFIFCISSLYSQTIDEYIEELKAEVKKEFPNFKEFSYERGKEIFFSKHIGKRGKKISCASCHTDNLKQNGENIFTGKVIKPLSPTVNPKRFTDVKKVKKWLRRNFKDVYKREGTALEKGDVLKFMMSR